MKKRKHYSTIESYRIVQLIRKKNESNPDLRGEIIEEIKAHGFVPSDWKLPDDFTEEDFKRIAKVKKRTNRKFLSEKWFFVALLCFIPGLFNKRLEAFLDSVLVNPVLSGFNAGLLADFLFAVVAAGLFGWALYWKFLVRKIIDWPAILVFWLIGIYVALYRIDVWGMDHWEFMPLHTCPAIMYLDIFLWIPLLLLAYKVSPAPKRKPHVTREANFKLHDDASITTVSEDAMGRKELAEYLAKHIVNTDSKRSFAIGINAKWGDGKTSFQQLTAEYLYEYDQDILIMEFNPWKILDARKIVEDFFIEYAAIIKPYNFRLGSRILSYSKTITDKNNGWWSGLIQLFQELGNPEDQFSAINSDLEKIDKKIVVFIDDLDRLNKDEITELIKLIRNSANFRNTFFIVGFDRDYVQEELGKITKYGQRTFLEKIFQMQLDLSHMPPGLIRDILNDSLIDRLPDHKEVLRNMFDPNKDPHTTVYDVFTGVTNADSFIPGLLTNMRDIRRFSNLFSLGVRLVGSEVVFEEYFYVSLLKFKFPSLVARLKRYRADCFSSKVPNSSLPYESIAEDKIKQLCNEEGIDTIDEDLVCAILNYLIKANDGDNRSVTNPEKFDLYFDDALNTQQLLFSEFIPLLNKKWPEIEYQVIRWIEDKKAGYLMEILNSVDPYTDTNRIEKVANIWVVMVNFNQYTERSTDSFLNLMGDKEKLHFYGTEGPVQFVRNLFNTKSQAFFYTTSVLRYVIYNYITGKMKYFPLTKDECQEIAVARLKEFIETRKEFDIRVFDFFYYNCWGSIADDQIVIMAEANRLVMDYINRHSTQYLRSVITLTKEPFISGRVYTFDSFIPQYFGSWNGFEDFLKRTAKMAKPVMEEFETMFAYFEDFKRSGYKSFTSEDVPLWIDIEANTDIGIPKRYKHQTYDALVQEYLSA